VRRSTRVRMAWQIRWRRKGLALGPQFCFEKRQRPNRIGQWLEYSTKRSEGPAVSSLRRRKLEAPGVSPANKGRENGSLSSGLSPHPARRDKTGLGGGPGVGFRGLKPAFSDARVAGLKPGASTKLGRAERMKGKSAIELAGLSRCT